jgi:hypothetical protein
MIELDEALLQQPYDDRQRQAVQGRARLSLAPAPSQFFNGAAPTRFDPQSAHYAQHVEADNEGGLYLFLVEGRLVSDQELDCYDQTEHGVRGLLGKSYTLSIWMTANRVPRPICLPVQSSPSA